MNNFEALIDGDRLSKAQANYDALVAAERTAGDELTAAKVAAQAAHALAQSAADRSEDLNTLDALEIAADAAERRVRTAGRLLQAATTKREAGALVRDAEIRSSHAKALNLTFARFIDIRTEALDAFAKLESLKAEHNAVRATFLALANAAKVGLPNLLDANHQLIMNGQLMAQTEFDNRLDQPHGHEWNVKTGQLRWTE